MRKAQIRATDAPRLPTCPNAQLAKNCAARKSADMESINAKWILDRLPKRRGAKGDLARAMGVRPETVSRIISGERAILASEIPRILSFFGEESLMEALGAQRSPGGAPSPALLRLMDRLSKLDDAELDFLTVAAEGLFARRIRAEDEE